jgi:ubiquilin
MLQNPQFMETMLNNDPTFKQLAESNPQFKEMLSNPELLSSLMTPENMAMAQNMMGMMGQQPGYALGGNPGSFPMPGGALQTGQSIPSTQPTVPSPYSLPQQPQQFPMYNPFMFQNPMQPNPIVPSQPQVSASTDYKALYKDQLSQMKEMGFINDDANLEALKKANGNVNAAVENMLAMFK